MEVVVLIERLRNRWCALEQIVIDWVYLPKFQGLFIKGKARNSLFSTRPLDFEVVALRVDFRHPRPPFAGVLHFALWKVTFLIRRYFS